MLIANLLAAVVRYHFRRHMHPLLGASLPRPAPQEGRSYLLYLHVPFCEHLCSFCFFHRVRFDSERAGRYFAALRDDIRAWHRLGYRFCDVYVGGGTPTVAPGELETTLALLRDLFPVRSISVETNPNHLLREEVLSVLERQGVNRLSVGVQSFDDALLQEMGRLQAYGSGAQILQALHRVQGRFATLNIDLLFNLPHQDMQSLQRDLRILEEELRVDQVSYYPLMIEPSTRRAISKNMGRPTSSREAVFYRAILDSLRPIYTPGSAWCFNRKPAALDEYIVDHRDFAAAGSGAFSYLHGNFYTNTFSIDRYLDLIGRGCSPLVAAVPLGRREQYRYALLMGLFGVRLDKRHLRAQYGNGIFDSLRWELFALKRAGAIEEDGDCLRLTERGMYYLVAMMREFFIGVNGLRNRLRLHVRGEPGTERCRDEESPSSERGGTAACCRRGTGAL
jgi:coproporphyrinogen III oxidase-like Fe-S oxidoreductase